jgi:hypothetical protein
MFSETVNLKATAVSTIVSTTLKREATSDTAIEKEVAESVLTAKRMTKIFHK